MLKRPCYSDTRPFNYSVMYENQGKETEEKYGTIAEAEESAREKISNGIRHIWILRYSYADEEQQKNGIHENRKYIWNNNNILADSELSEISRLYAEKDNPDLLKAEMQKLGIESAELLDKVQKFAADEVLKCAD